MTGHPKLLLLLLGAAACGDAAGPTPMGQGSIRVQVMTRGSGIDPDGYSMILDSTTSRRVGIQDSFSLRNLETGLHSLQLGDLAPDCQVSTSNPASAEVRAGESTLVQFDVVCRPPGALAVTVTTSGASPDPDGYILTLRGTGGAIAVLPANGSVTVHGLRPGTWGVFVSGLESNCAWTASLLLVEIDSAATSQLAIDVQCAVPSEVGRITVVVSTWGIQSFPLFYRVLLDSNPAVNIESNGTATLTGVSVGIHEVKLTVPQSYCGVSSGSPPSDHPTVVAGQTATVRFGVVCWP